MKAVLTYFGGLFKKTTNKYKLENIKFAHDGTIFGFDYVELSSNTTTSFTHFNPDLYSSSDKLFYDVLIVEGYYKTSALNLFLADNSDVISLKKAYYKEANVFFENVNKGDLAQIKRLHPDISNFNKYSNKIIYTFKVVDINKNYLKYKDYPIQNLNINSESYCKIEYDYYENPVEYPPYYFYKKTFLIR
jgi:hypothetical protein